LDCDGNCFAEIVKEGVKSEYFNPCNAKENAKIIMSAPRGFILSMIADPDNFFTLDECVNLLMKGLLKRNG
jgi:hypothetical protein